MLAVDRPGDSGARAGEAAAAPGGCLGSARLGARGAGKLPRRGEGFSQQMLGYVTVCRAKLGVLLLARWCGAGAQARQRGVTGALGTHPPPRGDGARAPR